MLPPHPHTLPDLLKKGKVDQSIIDRLEHLKQEAEYQAKRGSLDSTTARAFENLIEELKSLEGQGKVATLVSTVVATTGTYNRPWGWIWVAGDGRGLD